MNITKLKHFLESISPKFWIRDYPIDKEWDEEINKLMDEHDFILTTKKYPKLTVNKNIIWRVDTKEYTDLTINGNIIWEFNYPYAFGFKCDWSNKLKKNSRLPSRLTMVRMRHKILKDTGLDVKSLESDLEFDSKLNKYYRKTY